jgi:protein FrlC
MKSCMFTAGFSRYPLEEAYKAAKESGFDAIEIGGFRPHAHTWDILDGLGDVIKGYSKKYGLPVVSYAPENTGSPHSLVFEDPKLNADSLEYFKRTLDAAKAIDSEYCMFACNHPGYGRRERDVRKLFIDNIKELGKYAQNIGQTIILEPVTPYEGTILVSSDDLAWALEEVNNPRVKAMLDLACPITNAEPTIDYFTKCGPENIVHIHFIDSTPDSEDHLIPGDGAIDFEGTMRMLKQVGYDGYLSLELFSRYINEPYYAAKRGADIINGFIKGA